MQRSTSRILTTHTGSLPRPSDLLEAMRVQEETGGAFDQSAFDQRVTEAVADNVRRQAEAGIDVVNDGEVGKPSFQGYVNQRLSGFEARGRRRAACAVDRSIPTAATRENFRTTTTTCWRTVHSRTPSAWRRACASRRSRYVGQARVERDIANLKSAMADTTSRRGSCRRRRPTPQLQLGQRVLRHARGVRRRVRRRRARGIQAHPGRRPAAAGRRPEHGQRVGQPPRPDTGAVPEAWRKSASSSSTTRCATCPRTASAITPATASTSVRA